MADRYIRNSAGTLTETEALAVSVGAADAGKILALDGTGRIDNSMMPVGIGSDTASVTTSEALTAGDFVNIFESTGAKARKADASISGKEAHGFVLAAVASAAAATVYFEGTNTQLTGLTAGNQFLSATTPGRATSTAPVATGQVVQRLGVALSATALNFEPYAPIVLA